MKYPYLITALALMAWSAQSCKVVPPQVATPQDSSQWKTVDDRIPEKVPPQDTVEIKAFQLLKDTVRVIAVGDIMMGTNFPSPQYLPPGNGSELFLSVAEVLKRGDITFGNLEGVVLDSGGTQKSCKNPDLCYLFRTPESYVQNLVDAGFNLLSTANNHGGDFGEEGRLNTIRVLDSMGIHHAGLLLRPYTVFEIDHIKFGFAAFAPNAGTLSIHDSVTARKIVAHLDSISDIVIVSFHAGAEGSKYQNVTRENETFYGENRGNVYQFSHDMIDHGADLVFGHGPHITRATEVYNRRFIAYSLGNFCTYARFNLRNENGYAPIIEVATNSQGEFIQGLITPIVQKGWGGPTVDEDKRAIIKIQELTAIDFPESQIKIDPSGLITYIQD